jgi:hypothetical protein
MNAFIVELSNRKGEGARLTEAIARRGIDVTGFAGVTAGSNGAVVLTTDDEAATQTVLSDAGFSTREIELVTATLADKPGTLAAAFRKLADAGVNVEAAMPTGMNADGVNVGFATDDPTKARQALGSDVMAGATH